MDSSDVSARNRKPIIRMSELSEKTINPIRMIVENMKIDPNPNHEMISLSIGDPTIFGNLLPPKEALDSVEKSLRSHKFDGYAPSIGYPACREAVAKKFSLPSAPLTEKDVYITSGCSGAIDMVLCTLLNKGDNCLIPRPGFSLYKTICGGNGFEERMYSLLPEKMWEVDLDHMESLIDERTKCIIMTNPSNPCGSVYSKQHLKDILAVAEKHCIPILADEIYAYSVFPGQEYFPIASLTTTVPVLSVGAISKRYLVPGWRLGWVLIHDRDGQLDEVRVGMMRNATKILGACTVIQGAIPGILQNTPQEFFDKNMAMIHSTAKLAHEKLHAINGLKPIMPGGAMYMMVGINIGEFAGIKDDIQFTEMLMAEMSVFCLPGTCFEYQNFFRIVLTVPEHLIATACDRIAQFCAKHRSAGNGC